jgi:hypothetical protein
MQRHGLHLLFLALLAFVLAPAPARAAESFDACTNVISALPATVNAPGIWCMDQNLATSMATGNAINVVASNATIDCNNFILDGTSAGPTTATIGIAGANLLNTTIRRCDIRGFYNGVRLVGTTGGHLVEDNRFWKNTYIAAIVHGTGSVVRRNRVFDTGGAPSPDFAVGIYAAYSVDVLDNIVSGVTARTGSNGNAYGIHTESNPTGTLSGNLIRGLVRKGVGTQYGIYNNNSGRISLVDNDLTSPSPTGAIGLRCQDNKGSARGNVINGFANGMINCTPDGGNVVAQ